MPTSAPISIKLSAVLADHLGSFTLPDNSTEPAILTINNVDDKIPQGWKVAGLLCLLCQVPMNRSQKPAFQGVADLFGWQFELIQNDRSKNLGLAIECVLGGIQRARLVSHLTQNEDRFEQATFLISDQQYFRVPSD